MPLSRNEFPRRWLWIALVVVVVLLALVVIMVSQKRPEDAPLAPSLIAPAEFVGSTSCASCHSAEH